MGNLCEASRIASLGTHLVETVDQRVQCSWTKSCEKIVSVLPDARGCGKDVPIKLHSQLHSVLEEERKKEKWRKETQSTKFLGRSF